MYNNYCSPPLREAYLASLNLIFDFSFFIFNV